MRNYDEMFQRVLARRDAHLEQKKRKQRIALRVVPVIAGFGFAVLFGWHVWERQEKIPTAPYVPASTTTGETFITTASETTTMTVTESQTTGVQTETLTNLIETTTVSEVREPAASSTAVSTRMTTVIETAAMTAPPTEAPEAKTQQSTPAVDTTLPTLQQTSLTARSANPALIQPVTTQQSSAVTTTAVIASISESQITADSSPAEGTTTETAETKPAWEESTAAASTCESTTVSEPYLPGCSVTRISTTNAFDISYPVTGDTPEDFSICYHMEEERFSIQFSGVSDNAAVRNYFIYDNQLDSAFVIQQTLIKDFRLRWTDNGTTDLMPTGMGISGFFTYEYQTKEYHLYWSDGKYAMTVMADHPLYRLDIYSDIPTLFKADDTM